MKLAIMQPYFFPYLGYFDLIHNADLFIIYDTVQYIKQGWINRNRILHPNKVGWQYINVPVDSTSFHDSYRTSILDIKIARHTSWQNRLVAQLSHYKNNAPYFKETIEFIKKTLSIEESYISRLNVQILEQCTKFLNISFQHQFSSELDIQLDKKLTAEEKVLLLCEYFRAKEYINLPGGIDLYNPKDFIKRNIKLTFRKLPPLIYSTTPYTFEPNLSIIDVLLWNSPELIKKHLDLHRDTGLT
ncbi:MAG: WbqC family protein, partial [Candidatus Nitrosomaritimum yanchengensis]